MHFGIFRHQFTKQFQRFVRNSLANGTGNLFRRTANSSGGTGNPAAPIWACGIDPRGEFRSSSCVALCSTALIDRVGLAGATFRHGAKYEFGTGVDNTNIALKGAALH
jgi:hypothetical protein